MASPELKWGGVLPGVYGTAGGVSSTETTTDDDDEAGSAAADGMRERPRDRGYTMSAAQAILPIVWATVDVKAAGHGRDVPPEVHLYRSYTEGMLRRYLRLSMEAGRVPSLMGREMFRGRVTSYRIRGFDDAVIFVHDVERCLGRLTDMQRALIERIGLQEHTQGRAAGLLGMSLRTVTRRYAEAVDALTVLFLESGLLEPTKRCQGDLM